MKIVYTIIGILLLLSISFLSLGFFAKKDFKGEIIFEVDASVQQVWKLLNDIESLPKRRKEITKIEAIDHNPAVGYTKWKEYTDMGGHIIFEVLEKNPPNRLVLSMRKSTFGMKGIWVYQLEYLNENRTIVTISESSVIENYLLRCLFSLIGRDANLKQEEKLIKRDVLNY